MLPTIIAMTMNNPNQLPPLDEKGFGSCYWVEDGNCRAAGEIEQQTGEG